MSLSRTTGKFKLVENGNIALEKYTNETYSYLQKIPFVVSIVDRQVSCNRFLNLGGNYKF